MGRIVVGVDGSPGSLAALRFALEEARLRSDTVVAIQVWVLPLVETPGPFLLEVPTYGALPLDQLRDDMTRGAHQRVTAMLHELGDVAEGVEVEQRVVEGRPAAALVDASADADLLVVGSRGHGGFGSLLLGSVSQQCAQHARCPVVIVPGPASASAGAA